MRLYLRHGREPCPDPVPTPVSRRTREGLATSPRTSAAHEVRGWRRSQERGGLPWKEEGGRGGTLTSRASGGSELSGGRGAGVAERRRAGDCGGAASWESDN